MVLYHVKQISSINGNKQAQREMVRGRSLGTRQGLVSAVREERLRLDPRCDDKRPSLNAESKSEHC
jgi:hypothetical protein